MAKNMINGSKKTCGCLLVHLFQEKFPEDKGTIFAGFLTVESSLNRVSIPDFSLAPYFGYNKPKTYKQLKEIAGNLK